ncbi:MULTISPECIES: EcsC family protein [unclassified Acinetobacter]|uniref:EcsC family protein n=1 Tax=unclassified Acinetobacter TaxID=196816 RepID=UPI002882AC5A|nr:MULTISPECIES: EcsC family protein [unclassified Acinetobacter]MDT0199218.1 EcsC family protein [Acinetobacter sp. RG5]MDT0230736.1 EcsC family protein [Acinetobacter sp. RRD8]
MVNANNKQSNGLISNAFGVAKKFSSTGLDLLNHVAPDSVTKALKPSSSDQVIDGSAKTKSAFSAKKYDNPQQMLREHLPNVSRQLLGRRFNTVNNVAHFVSPDLTEKVSNYFYDRLNQFSNQTSSVDAILNEAGAKDLEELTQDVDRSKRISQALGEQNKWIATVQGAVSGASGMLGTAIDIPASLLMALRTIYQVGRSYGFDLSKEDDQEIVQHIFRQIDLSLIAEKQTLLLGLKALSNTLKTHDISQLQAMLGSDNDVSAIKQWLSRHEGEAKWEWMNHLPKISILERLTKLTPLASAGIGAVYSHRFVEDVNQKAQEAFSHARQYLIQHQDSQLSPYAAYEKAVSLLQQATPKLLNGASHDVEPAKDKPIMDKDIAIEGNNTITQVKLVKKEQNDLSSEEAEVKKDEKVSEGLEALNDELVEPAVDKQSQQPALTKTSFDPEIEAELHPEAADEAEAATETSQQGVEDQENSETESEAQDVTKKAGKNSKK